MSVAWAVNECGVASGSNPTIICDGINNGLPNEPGEINVAPNSEVNDANPHTGGVRYNVPGITIQLDGTAAPFIINRASGSGVISFGNSAAPNVIDALGTVNINAAGTNQFGLGAGNSVGEATINYNDGDITVGTGTFGVGIYAQASGSENTTINYNAGTISTVGNFSYSINAWSFGTGDAIINYKSGTINGGLGDYVGGPYARATGSGNVLIDFTDGTVNSVGTLGFGAIAQTDGAGDADLIFRSGTVNTSGNWAIGVHAYVGGTGALSIDVGETSVLNTTGVFANGILGTTALAGNTTDQTITNAGTLTTSGDDAYGIWGWHGGSGDILIENTGDITAAGIRADGIRAEHQGTGQFRVDVDNSTIQSGTGLAAGIHTSASAGGTINVAAAAQVDGSASGIAIRDGDLDGDGVDEVGGNVVVNSAGTLTGDSILGLGNDVFNLTAGSVTGDIFGDDIAASAADGNDTFNWSGGALNSGFFGGNGSDAATISGSAIYDGTETLDGGDDATDADGWIDTLVINGVTATVNSGTIINWEAISLVNANLDFVDLIADGTTNTGALNVCGGTTSLSGSSVVSDILACASNETLTITDDTTITGDIQGAGGSDTITVTGNSSVNGTVFGGQNGQDTSAAADVEDHITINTTGTVGSVEAGTGNDTMDLLLGTITSNVLGGAGNDTIQLNGAVVQGILNGEDGNDQIDIVSGTALTVLGGADDDMITVIAGMITTIAGDNAGVPAANGKDNITLNGGSIGSVMGDGGNDLIVLNGATISGPLAGDTIASLVNPAPALGNGDDQIQLLSGQSNSVDAGAGNDTVLLAGATVTTSIEGGSGADQIELRSGRTNSVGAGAGNDTILLTGATVATSITGGTGDDLFQLQSGLANSLLARQGDDAILLAGATIASTIEGHTGNDNFTWTSGNLAGFSGGQGSDTTTVSATEFDGSQVLNGGDDTSTADGFIDSLTLNGITAIVSGSNVLNWEQLLIDAGSNITLTGGVLSAGATTVTNGSRLDAGNGLTLNGDLTISAGGEFIAASGGIGLFVLNGDLTSNSIVTTRDGFAGDTITVTGNYAGSGTLNFDTVLDDGATSRTDRLTVNGNSTGSTTINVTNDGGTGGVTGTGPTDGIEVVHVDGLSSGTFSLSSPLTVGVYDYSLVQSDTQNWYLQSSVQSQIFGYSALQAPLRDDIETVWQRVGQRGRLLNLDGSMSTSGSGFWMRTSHSSTDAQITTSVGGSDFTSNLDYNKTLFQLGYDQKVMSAKGGMLMAGVFGHYKKLSMDVNDVRGASLANSSANGYGGGASLSWHNLLGVYADLAGQISFYDIDVSGSDGTTGSFDATSYSISAEAGYRFKLDEHLRLVPQAQLVWQRSNLEDFTDSRGNMVDWNDKASLTGRIGLALEGGLPSSQGGNGLTGYAIANLVHEFTNPGNFATSGTNIDIQSNQTRFEGRIGVNLSSPDDHWTFFTEVGYAQSIDNQEHTSFKGVAGIRLNF